MERLNYRLVRTFFDYKMYQREDNGYTLEIVLYKGELIRARVLVGSFQTQKELDYIQIAFNNLQMDLKELNKNEN